MVSVLYLKDGAERRGHDLRYVRSQPGQPVPEQPLRLPPRAGRRRQRGRVHVIDAVAGLAQGLRGGGGDQAWPAAFGCSRSTSHTRR